MQRITIDYVVLLVVLAEAVFDARFYWLLNWSSISSWI